MEHKYYYAIKIGNGVRDLIVNSWDECQNYVIGYEAIYQKFDSKRKAKKWLEAWTNEKIEARLIWNKLHRFNRLKVKIEKNYGFSIPDYIIDEILNGNNYNNLCMLLNLATISNRLSKENAKKIKDTEFLKYKQLKTITRKS